MKNPEYLVLIAMLVAALLVLSAVIGIRLSDNKTQVQMLRYIEQSIEQNGGYQDGQTGN